MGTQSASPNLELAFDVGHSSLGWAVLRSVAADVRRLHSTPAKENGQSLVTSAATGIELLGCGVVTFGADDCLSAERRKHRQQRRHIRATRQRIVHMENFLAALKAIDPERLKNQHAQGKGNRRGEGKGFSYPWLLAARLLASKPEDRHKHLLTWEQLWDVLRWYAHNRGYDENIRWSGDFKVHEVSPVPTISAKDVADKASKAKDAEKGADADKPASAEGDTESSKDTDSDKLKMAETLMGAYDFETRTFAETVAKFLLGPDRTVTPGAPGKAGKLADTKETFSQEKFHRLLFGLDEEYRNHPRHLRNYFKGLRCAFVRRKVDDGEDGKRILAGGTEWEVRTIIHAHFDAPLGKARCDTTFERMICGGTPEKPDDWRTLKVAHPALYFSTEETVALREQLRKHRTHKNDSTGERRAKHALRRELAGKAHKGKIVLPKRYQGGLLFGQLVPRLKNRIIAQCPITYCRKLRMFTHVLGGLPPYKAGNVWSEEASTQMDAEIKEFQRRLDKAKTQGRKLQEVAEEFAAILAKVPSRNSTEFLNFRWAMLLANLKVRKPGDRLPPGEKLRPLTKQERADIDAKARELGFLRYEREETKKVKREDGTEEVVVKKKEINDLAAIVFAVTGCTGESTNLDGFFIPPDAREGLKIVPAKGEAFRLVWKHLDAPLRRRFTHQLLRRKGGKPHKISIFQLRRQLKRLGHKNPLAFIKTALTEKARKGKRVDRRKYREWLRESFSCDLLEGRARYHRDVLRQAVREIMNGEDPRKKIVDELFLAPRKIRDGCLAVSDDMQQTLDERPVAGQTNNHLVRHRIQVLAGDMHRGKHGEILPRNSLLDDLLAEFADEKTVEERLARVGRITIEVTRDLQEMSSLSNKQKQALEDAKREHHSEIADWLAEELKDQPWNGRPIKITPQLITKARVAHDLGRVCPYTTTPSTRKVISAYELATGEYDLDHIIPKSQRLSNAMEALVVTSRRINAIKGNRTAMQFIKEMNLPHSVRLKQELGIVTPDQFKEFVESLSVKGPSKDDVRRRKKRKELLKVENWNEAEFTPRDLTNTAYVVKLAAQRLRARFAFLSEKDRPPVIYIPGSVTSTFRDKGWRAIHELAAVHEPIAAVVNSLKKEDARHRLDYAGDTKKERRANRKKLVETGEDVEKFMKKWGKEILTSQERDDCKSALTSLLTTNGQGARAELVRFRRTTVNLKQTIRGMTRIHHALDAAVLALVTHYLVPPRNHSLDGKLAKWIVKGHLTDEERDEFRRLYYGMHLGCRFGARRFWAVRFEGKTPDDRARKRDEFLAQCNDELQKLLEKEATKPFTYADRERFDQLVSELDLPRPFQFDARNRIRIRPLDKATKGKLHAVLKDAIQNRVIEHIPADRSGLALDETVYRVITEQSELDALAHRLHKGQTSPSDKWPALEPGHAIIVVRKRRGLPGMKKPKKCLLETSAYWFAWDTLPKRKLFGLQRNAMAEQSKLARQKAAKVITGNFGFALLKHVASTENEERLRMEGAEVANVGGGKKVFLVLIRRQAVHYRLEELRAMNNGKRPELLRNGMLVDVPNGTYAQGRWRVASVKDKKDGLKADLRSSDGVEDVMENKKLVRLVEDGLSIPPSSLCGVAQAAPAAASA